MRILSGQETQIKTPTVSSNGIFRKTGILER